MKSLINTNTLTLCAAVLIFTISADLPTPQRLCAAVYTWAIISWALEALPLWLTSVLAPSVLVLLQATPSKILFNAAFDPIIFLFIGSFIIARAMELAELPKRAALLLLSKSALISSKARLLGTFALLSCGLSLVMSNTAVTALLLPLGLAFLKQTKLLEDLVLSRAVILMLSWGSSVAVGVIIGTPPNLIASDEIARQTGQQIGFVEWMIFGMPLTAALLTVAWLILLFACRASRTTLSHDSSYARRELKALGPTTRRQRWTLGVLAVVMALWILPEGGAAILGADSPIVKLLTAYLSPSVAACIGAVLISLGAPTHKRTELLRINWSTIVLFAGGIALGRAGVETGLAQTLGAFVQSQSDTHSLLTMTLVATFVGILLSEFTSNTAAAALGVPLIFSIAQQAGLNPLPPALGLALGTSLGFMMPISTPPNSIVYSSGLIPIRYMLRYGVVLDLLGGLATVLVLRLVLPLMGWW